ncbi:protein of unknown function [Taphrina deformans PYCC 5710]|uniref:Uncharacterized protein n=1 Tax=Taphrina deformans (strain PYCC 5710 / ATCC 11124 / CBS 356.35 / IMI 108563 / JCM 9778 / NBRC 8474) TaxID=1097556 RepID=R4XIC3_TAPDE|nr:protein of unknown function [Taphrina deformans PYCC 5710]|eukprot:CCG84254.1 protein of unknown function [Taphrina deformans PYCC 5710]
MGTVRNNNPFNPFSSNTTNPKQWGQAPDQLKPTQDFIELAAFSLFFAGIYWASLLVLFITKGWFAPWLTVTTFVLLAGTLVGAAALCYRRCELWYEYGAMEYWQPLKNLVRAGIAKKGLYSLGSGLLILLGVIVYGPFLVGTVAWVDELGQRAHRE